MTIKQLFETYPLIQSRVGKNIGLLKQQVLTYSKGVKPSDITLDKFQKEVNKIGEELSKVKLTK